MQPFTTLVGVAAPLMRENIDTDVIIRIERLVGRGRDELEPYAFEAWRYLPDGTPNPGFVLNQPDYRNAEILLTGKNFGCGSSREGGVWALQGLGLRCIVAPSFGDIFYGNCFQNGVLPIVLPAIRVEALARQAAARPQRRFVIDLPSSTIVAPDGEKIPFHLEALPREMLLGGVDELGMTLKREDLIGAFQERDRQERPWIYLGSPASGGARRNA